MAPERVIATADSLAQASAMKVARTSTTAPPTTEDAARSPDATIEKDFANFEFAFVLTVKQAEA